MESVIQKKGEKKLEVGKKQKQKHKQNFWKLPSDLHKCMYACACVYVYVYIHVKIKQQQNIHIV